jgi:hypothetical protein
MSKCNECFVYEFQIRNLETGFYMAATDNNPRVNMERLLQLVDRISELRTERDEHRKAHDRAA